MLHSSEPHRLQEVGKCGEQPVEDPLESKSQSSKARAQLETALVHVNRPIDLDLERMPAVARRAIVLSDEAAGIRLVANDPQALAAQEILECSGDLLSTGRAVTIAQHDVDARAAVEACMRAGG